MMQMPIDFWDRVAEKVATKIVVQQHQSSMVHTGIAQAGSIKPPVYDFQTALQNAQLGNIQSGIQSA